MKPEIKERIEKIRRGEVPEGYKKTKIGIIPESWEITKLKNIGTFRKGKGISKSDLTEVGLPCVRYGEIYTSHHYYIKEFYSFIPENLRDSTELIKQGDILFAGSGETQDEIGKAVAYLDYHEAYAGGDIVIMTPTENSISKYLGYALNGELVNIQRRKLGQGHSVVHIYAKDLESIRVPIPEKNEQQKIAEILSTWDKAIELKEKLIEEKKKQKKGLMQLLLTGKKRLPGFKGEWKEVRLGSQGTTYNGLSGKTASDFGTGKPFIPYKNIFSNSKIDISYVDYVNIDYNENQTKVKYGDIFFTTSSETPEEVAISSVLLDDVKEMYLNSFCFGFRLNNFRRILPEFLRFYLRSDAFRRKVYRLAQGSTRFNISKNEIMKIKINIPEINEQRAIAKVLEACEKQIRLLEQELEAIKLQKKGLMQLLLTGIVRVTDN